MDCGIRAGGQLAVGLAALIAATAALTGSAVAAAPWQGPDVITKGRSIVAQPQVGIAADGFAAIAWQTERPQASRSRVWLAVRRTSAHRFSSDRTIGGGVAGSLRSGVSATESLAILGWLNSDDQVHVAFFDEADALFGRAKLSAQAARHFDLDVADDGTAIAAWRTGQGIWASVRLPGEGFAAPVKITGRNQGHVLALQASAASNGGAAVAWTRTQRGTNREAPVVSVQLPATSGFSDPERMPGVNGGTPVLSAVELTDSGRLILVLGGARGTTSTLRLAVKEPGAPLGESFEAGPTRGRWPGNVLIDSAADGVATLAWSVRSRSERRGTRWGIVDIDGVWLPQGSLTTRARALVTGLDIVPGGARLFSFGYRSREPRRAAILALRMGSDGKAGRYELVSRAASPVADPLAGAALAPDGTAIVSWGEQPAAPKRLLAAYRPH